MDDARTIANFFAMLTGLNGGNRPLRLRLSMPDGVRDDQLLPQRVTGSESLCGGIEYWVLCVSTDPCLPLKQFIAVAAELQIVTDGGELRSVCGLVAQAAAGDADGGLATYQLVIRDALALMEKRVNTRIFRNKNEIDITRVLFGEWTAHNPILAGILKLELAGLFDQKPAPVREFTMQHNESDAAFLRRLWKRRGIAWLIRSRAGGGHTLVLFDSPHFLPRSNAGTVRYHRDHATEQRDTVTGWQAIRTLQPGTLERHSWNYAQPDSDNFQRARTRTQQDHGPHGNAYSATLDDFLVDMPHAGDSHDDYCTLGELRMLRHDYEAKCFTGEGSVRDFCAGEWFALTWHPEIDAHPAAEREFLLTSVEIDVENNLPKEADERVRRLFNGNRWLSSVDSFDRPADSHAVRYRNRFTCVRRGVAIVPAFDPRTDLPRPQLQSALVVGPEGEEVHCDAYGRVKIRFPAVRVADHEHAHGVGANYNEHDSAWVRVASNWAGDGGAHHQCGTVGLPRVGSEVLIDFMGGDPDKPIIVAQLYNFLAHPPALSVNGELPGNRYLAGMRSREIKGARGNQLRLDDTSGQISAQLASDHGNSELNLGWLTEPRKAGKGRARGEGIELRSDEAMALRSAKGMLLSTWQRFNAKGNAMDRAEYLDLMEECVQLFRSLGNYAAKHEALAIDDKDQSKLQKDIGQWEQASNTDPQAEPGGEPAIGVTAPAGISFATPKTVLTYAGVNLDTVAQQHMQLTAGQRYNVNAGKGISLFSHHDGIRVIAHHGKLLMQSQHDHTQINAAKDVTITATEGKILGMAKEIVLIADDGSFIKIGGGITLGTKGTIAHHAALFPFTGPQTMKTELPVFKDDPTDERFVLKYLPHVDGGTIAANRKYAITLSDGAIVKGVSDAEGKTDLLERDAMQFASIEILSRDSE
ncbi:MAG TPA: type VI secretion system Vgr family protein [Burkholderiaceae bacterium]